MVLKLLPEEYKSIKHIVLDAIKAKVQNIEFVDESLYDDNEVIELAADLDPELGLYYAS